MYYILISEIIYRLVVKEGAGYLGREHMNVSHFLPFWRRLEEQWELNTI